MAAMRTSPPASPSMPSVMLTAFEVPATSSIVSRMNGIIPRMMVEGSRMSPFRSGLVGPEERQGQGMGGIIADPEPVEVPAAEQADADLKEQFFPGEDSGTGARRSSRDRQLQPIVGEPDSGQPHKHNQSEMDVPVAEIGQQQRGHQNGPADDQPPHCRREPL